jgi:hypothetical protein
MASSFRALNFKKFMIGTIRRHQQWLWGIIILAIIVSFVIYFSPNSRNLLSSGGDNYDFGSINGKAITREQYRDANAEVELFYFLRVGKWPGREDARQNGFDTEQETYQRIVLIEKLKQLDIQPSVEAAAKWIGTIFRGPNEETFPIERYQNFVKNELQPHHLTSEDFYRFASHQVAQQQLMSTFGMAGKLITPQEAESFYRRANEPMATEAVFFSASNFLSSVSATPEEIGRFYTNNMAEYRLPDRMQVNYVKWSVTNFLADADQELGKITNLSQRLEIVYTQTGGTNRYKDASGKPLSLEAAKAQIKEEEREKIARDKARKEAADFISDLFKGHDESHPFSIDDLQKVAKAKNLKMETTPPFDQRNGARQLHVPQTFVNAAFNLQADDPEDKGKELLYSSSPLMSDDAAYAIGFAKKIPSEIQPLDKIRAEVTRDYREQESLKLARQSGMAFDKAATNSIAQGKKFSDVCAQFKVSPVDLPPFSMSTRSLPALGGRATLDSLQSVAATLATGKASEFVPTASGGFVLFLKAKLPVDEAKMKEEMPEFLANQREQRMSAAFSEWVHKLPQEMQLVVPARNSTGKS